MASYGLLDEGFVDKPIEDIISDLETDQRATMDPGLDVSTTSPIGQLNGIFGAALRELWEVAQAVHSAFDPDKSSGVSLSSLSAMTGTLKEGATKSTVVGRLNIDAGVTVPAGSVASVDGNPAARFITLADATNGGGAPSDFDVDMEAEDAGPVVANSGTLTVIETTVSGWNTITNPADAVIGNEEEEDGDLRTRREEELRATGAGSVEAIRADILAIDDVLSCEVYENISLATDADGVPGKAFEAVVQGGVDQAILDRIWQSKPAGIEPHGTTSGTVTDSQDIDHTIKFTRPAGVTIYIDVTVETNTDPDEGPVFPADGATQIKTAIVEFAQDNFRVGDEYVYRRLYSVILAIDGVLDVPVLESDTSASPSTEQNIAITSRQIANVQTANITVAEV